MKVEMPESDGENETNTDNPKAEADNMSWSETPTGKGSIDGSSGKKPGNEVGRDNCQGLNTYSYADIVAVTVGIGNQKVKYGIHKRILVSRCPFFDKCLGAGMKEAQENAITLPDDDPNAFDVVVEWIYTGHLNSFGTPRPLLVHAYILADKYCMRDLQNAIVDVLRNGIPPSLSSVSWAWEKLSVGSLLRQVLLDRVHHHIIKYPLLYKQGRRAAALEEVVHNNPRLTTALLWKMLDYSRQFGSEQLSSFAR